MSVLQLGGLYTKLEEIRGLISEAISDIVDTISCDLKNSVSAHITSNELRFAREQKSKKDDTTIISQALAAFEKQWVEFDGRLSLMPGKEALKKVFERIQKDYGVSITTAMIQEQMGPEEFGDELLALITKLDVFFSS